MQTGRVIKLTRFAVFTLAGFDEKLAIDGRLGRDREILWRQVPIVVSVCTVTARGFFFLVARELFQVFPGFVAFLELFFVAEILEEDLVVDDKRQIFAQFAGSLRVGWGIERRSRRRTRLEDHQECVGCAEVARESARICCG